MQPFIFKFILVSNRLLHTWRIATTATFLIGLHGLSYAQTEENFATKDEEELISKGFVFFPPKKIRPPNFAPSNSEKSPVTEIKKIERINETKTEEAKVEPQEIKRIQPINNVGVEPESVGQDSSTPYERQKNNFNHSVGASPYYMGYEVGAGRSSVPNVVQEIPLKNIDNSTSNSRIFIGKEINDSIGIEVGYFVNGKTTAVTNYSRNNIQLAEAVKVVDVTAVIRPLPDKSLFILGGVTYGQDLGLGYEGRGKLAGIGYEIPFYNNTLRLSYKKYFSPALNSFDVSTYSLGLTVPFDKNQSNYFATNVVGEMSLGLVYSNWNYSEKTDDDPEFMSERANFSGFLFNYSLQKNYPYIPKLEMRFSNGLSNYASHGSTSNNINKILDIRLLSSNILNVFNIDFPKVLLGVGYRELNDDARGVSSLGGLGYRRTSQYKYIPIVLENSIATAQKKIVARIEYDYFISGEQKSFLSDTQIRSHDISNLQSKGYGLRGSLSFQHNDWTIEPFVEYWSIGDSDKVYKLVWPYIYSYMEPKNKTKEVGLKIFKSF